jgi:hypothetical protein
MNHVNTRLVFLVLFSVFLLILLSGCEQIIFFEKRWELSGDAQLTGFNNIAAAVKLAAFYINEKGGNLTAARIRVSEVRDLGAFDLTIDMSSFNPGNGDEVQIYMWEDTNANDAYDNGEDKAICAPDAGCAVFDDSALAVFFFILNDDNYDDGWYLNSPAGIVPVENAALTGALLINNSKL